MPVLDRPAAYRTPQVGAQSPIHSLTQRHLRWVHRAISVAKNSSHSFRMGSVGVRGGTVLGSAVNRFRNHPTVVDDWWHCSVHSEQALAAGCSLAGSDVYVARLDKSGSAALAKPCRECWETLHAAGVRSVMWTVDPFTVAVANFSADRY